MGCSNPHPQGQILAQETIPKEPAEELRQQQSDFKKHARTFLGDYFDHELKEKEQIVVQNDDFVGLVPFWAFWPFDTLLVSSRPFGRFTDITDKEKTLLADIMKK